MNKKLLNHSYNLNNLSIEKCLFTNLTCDKKAIRAHSVQNSKDFNLISEKDHVAKIIQYRTKNHEVNYKWKLIGRNKASTFTGLCSNHDMQIFQSIDTQYLDIQNNQHLFLLAYRSIHKELHENIIAAAKLQSTFQELINQGIVPRNTPSKEGMLATSYIANFIDTILYKEKFDKAYEEMDYSFLAHQSIVLKNQAPVLSCSQLFSVDSMKATEDVLRITLNVSPISHSETLVVFSYLDCDANLAENYLSKVFRSLEGSQYFKYNLSKTIIENCSNFFINPNQLEKWSEQKKNSIINLFSQTIYEPSNSDSKEFYLF